MEYAFVLAGSFALLFLIILISNKGKRTAHWILAALLSLIVISCYYVFRLYHHNGQYYIKYFSELNFSIPLLYGVLLWFYTKSLLQKNYKLDWREALHFIPFVLFFLYLIFFTSKEEAILEMGFPLVKLIINPIYIFLTIALLRKFRKRLFDNYSYENEMHLYWLSWIAYGGLGLWLVACLGNIFNWYNDYNFSMLGDYFLISFLAVFLFILAYVGFNRTKIFQPVEQPRLIPETEVSPRETVETAKDDQLALVYEALDTLMKTEKPYLDAKLNLHQLSTQAKVPTAKLSNAINQIGQMNFYDFVNQYRVNAVKEMLVTDELEQYSILGIAEECGFNSKASFNRVFKKFVGKTPTEYLKGLSN